MFETIPQCIKDLRQWVCVQADSKIPIDAKTGKAASSINPDTWCDFQTAVSLVEQGAAGNIGFVFNDNGLVGVDIDAGYDEYGLMSALASIIIGKCRSYTEKSRSGRGFHILIKGEIPFKGKNNLAGLEIYKASRYFIMTGETLIFRTIESNQEAIDYILNNYFCQTKVNKNTLELKSKIYTPVWKPPVGRKVSLRPEYPPIKDGTRNISLTSLAGQMHSLGYSRADIYKELQYVNINKCIPPLENRELKTICASVTRYDR